MNSELNSLKRKLVVTLALLCPGICGAETQVSGDISGRWSPSGNPYVVIDTSTVPPGRTLTIEPGVVIWIGSNVSINVNGQIRAVGAPTNRITFQPPGNSSWNWNVIAVNGNADTNQFMYCDFLNANNALALGGGNINQVKYCNFQNIATAISISSSGGGINEIKYCNIHDGGDGIAMGVYGGNTAQTDGIMNCTFSNITSRAIYGEAQGTASCGAQSGVLSLVVKNCVFNSVGSGCNLKIFGQLYICNPFQWYTGYGYVNSQIVGNVFFNVTNTAFLMDVGSYAGGGNPSFINNTVVNAGTGVSAQDPWDAKVQDCIFVGNTNAVIRSGSFSSGVSYNCFYQNVTDFTGYPGTYGTLILVNRNGTASDIAYNILSDPLFVSVSDFQLRTNSPCIDSGTPDWAYTDMCFPPGQRKAYPDLGAYGGPDACNWLDDVPVLPVTAFMTQSDGVVALNWGAIPRSTYQVLVTNNHIVGLPLTNNWTNFPNGYITSSDKPTSMAVPMSASVTQQFFKVQSLGRSPGN